MANTQRDAVREQYWRDVLKRQTSSGLSVREFCRRESLAETSFYAWRRTINQRNSEVKPAEQTPQFVPAVVTDTPPRDPSIAIELASGYVLRLPSSTTTKQLVDLVVALETREQR